MKFSQSIACLLIFACSSAIANHSQLTKDQLLDETSGPGFELFRNAFVPPNDADTNYPFYPTSGNFSAGANTYKLVFSESKAEKYLFVWVNRCTSTPNDGNCGVNTKGNLPQIQGNRFYFSDIEKANSCTEAQLWQSMSAYTTARNVILDANMTPAVPEIAVVDNKEKTIGILGIDENNRSTTKISTQTWLGIAQKPEDNRPSVTGYVDTCVLEPSAFVNEAGERRLLRDAINGVVLDYEPQDGRTPKQTSDFLKEAKRIISLERFAVPLHAPDSALSMKLAMCDIADDIETCKTNERTKKVGLWTNPLTSATTTANNGISRAINGREIIDLLDFVSLLAYYRHDESLTGRSIANELRAQEAIYRPKFKHLEKIYVILGMGYEPKGTNASLQLISEVSNYVRSRGYRGIATWNNGARQRSDAYFEQIKCLIARPNNQDVDCSLEP